MEFNVKSGSPEKQRSACIIVGVFEPRRLSSQKLVEILGAAVEGNIPTNLVISLLWLGIPEMAQLILPLSLFQLCKEHILELVSFYTTKIEYHIAVTGHFKLPFHQRS